MKKVLSLFLAVAVALALINCSIDGGGDAGPVAPDMGSASDLAASGATTYPADQSAALALFIGAQQAVTAAIDDNTDTDAPESFATPKARFSTKFAAKGGALGARGTNTQTIPINFSGTVGAGTMTLSGSDTATMTAPDQGWTPSPNTTYNDLMAMSFVWDVTGIFNGITYTIDDGSGFHEYAITGKAVEKSDVSMNFDYTFGSSTEDVTGNVDVSVSLAEGFAVSVRRDDGLGAKFIVSFAYAESLKDLDLEAEDDPEGFVLGDEVITIKVYDDANVLLGSYAIPFSEFEA